MRGTIIPDCDGSFLPVKAASELNPVFAVNSAENAVTGANPTPKSKDPPLASNNSTLIPVNGNKKLTYTED